MLNIFAKKEAIMSTLAIYTGYDFACFAVKMEGRAQHVDPAKVNLLQDTVIRITDINDSLVQAKTELLRVTGELHPILREICLVIQKVVFWCLGIESIEISLLQKQQTVDSALQTADPAAVNKCVLATKIPVHDEIVSVTIGPHRPRGFIAPNECALRIHGHVVAILQEKEAADKAPKTLVADIISKQPAWVPVLTQVILEIAQREKDIRRVEVQADPCYHEALAPLRFDVMHEADLSRRVGKVPATPDHALKEHLAKMDAEKKQKEAEADAPPIEHVKGKPVEDGVNEPHTPIAAQEDPIWWLDKPDDDQPDHPLVKKPDHPLLAADFPLLEALKA
jgi:hypothetical protein